QYPSPAPRPTGRLLRCTQRTGQAGAAQPARAPARHAHQAARPPPQNFAGGRTHPRRCVMSEKNVWLMDSPVSMVAGEQIAYSVDWQGATSVSAAQASVYRNGVDITSEAM